MVLHRLLNHRTDFLDTHDSQHAQIDRLEELALHLSSASQLYTIMGTLMPDNTTRFLPYGECRVEPENGLMDVGFTRHRGQEYKTESEWQLPSGQTFRIACP
jgi:hypothetical protein